MKSTIRGAICYFYSLFLSLSLSFPFIHLLICLFSFKAVILPPSLTGFLSPILIELLLASLFDFLCGSLLRRVPDVIRREGMETVTENEIRCDISLGSPFALWGCKDLGP